MDMTRRYVQEAARLAERKSDGTYPVVIISEGTGSTGVYSADLISSSAHVFENVPSFINHPIDPEKPHERDLNSIAGRLSNVTVGEDAGRTALLADFKPRKEYESLFEEFGDIIGLSIYCGAAGEADDTGRIVVQEFDALDPYRSVDAVVAAGRGGRFKKAQESLRAIESSLGLPEGTQPDATSAQESNKEEHMEEVLKAIEALAAEFKSFVAEQKAAADAQRQAEADAEAKSKDAAEAVEAAVAAVEAVKAAKVLAAFESKLIESAKKGADISEDLEFAKKVTAEASAAAPKDEDDSFIIHESAANGDDFSLNLGGRY